MMRGCRIRSKLATKFLIIQNCHVLGALVVCTIAKGALRQRHLIGVTDIQMIVLGAMERMLEVSKQHTCYLLSAMKKQKGHFGILARTFL